MASIDLEYNSGFQIYNSDGTPFHNLVLHKCTYETVVMSLGDKISGILYYKDNALDVTMSEYIIYKGVRYTLVNPPTILREGLVSDNSELRGMTKYSFTFYHPMYVLNNFPFSDIAVQSGESRYLSQNKTFSWIGTLVDFVAKLNKNLEDTQWMVTIGNVTQEEQTKLSEVLSFDKNTIAEALKRGYETWEVPYVVDQLAPSSQYYPEKRFVVQYGLPTTEILDEYNQPFVFQMGQGVGLKNNSRNPKNNKIITRIAGYGSEDNIPYGYPQIPYYGGNVQYPLYYGIVGGHRVQLIKHPFTRNHLMPSVYSQSVYNKVNPKLPNGNNNPNYDPTIELVDYYDANDNTYTNRIKPNSPSYEIHEFGDIKPELGEKSIISAVPVSQQETQSDYKQKADFLQEILDRISATEIEDEKTELLDVYDRVDRGLSYYKKHGEEGGDTYWYVFSITNDDYYEYVSYESSNYNFTATVLRNGSSAPTPDWDDTMDDDGNYLQSYFKITLPTLEFDLYACAAITQEMKINMRSGACIGCTFPVEVDWDDYKRNFYNSDGEFAPDGEQRDYTKYPDSSNGQITVMIKKELETFGTLMPNQYQQPTTGDKFVILGISLPNTYITSAEQRLDTDMKQYMRDNNVYYFDYPLKFDEHFLISHEDILSQMKNNVVVRFNYAGTEHALYIKQMSVKYNESPLPKYDITLTDDIEIVLNQIGQVTDEVSRLRLGFGAGGFGTVGAEYIRKDIDDTARGTIRMIKGMQVGERFVTGLLGEGGVFRKDSDGTTYLETDKLYVRMKAYFDTVEVKHYLHTGGNRIASQASGIVCSRVEMIDAHNNLAMNVADAVLFRCFFKANDGDKTIRNDFMIGDLAFCRETNVNVSEVNMHGYWRLVVGRNYNGFLTDNKEGWIDLSNRSSETLTIGGRRYTCNGYQNGSDAPIAQDDIIQLGNIADKDRQGAIVEYVGGEDAPSYQIFQGIGEDLPYPYTLEDKNYIGLGYSSQIGHAYMNVYGDMFIGAKPDPTTGESSTYIKYVQEDDETGEPRLKIKAEVEFIHSDGQGGTESTTMDDFIDAIKQSMEDIQDQIDGSIDTWYYEGTPTLNNEPAVNWTTPELKHEHIGDLYYDKTNGDAYRFILDTSVTPNEYKWIQLHDDAITEALRLAAEAKDTADHKRRVFLTQPVPPYDQGDLWVNAVWPASGQHQGETYNNEILKCVTAKTDEQTFSISDWSVANGYTAALNDFLTNTYAPFISNIQGQVDQKAETWYQDSNPATAWYDATQTPVYDVRAKHIGDIWMDTSANGGKQTYIYQYNTSTANYEWKPQSVPNEVFDYADGKCAIYVNNPTNTQNPYPTNYHEKDMWILPVDGTHDTYTIGGVEFKAGEVLFSSADSTSFVAAHWSKKLRYTGDERIDGFINQILNGTGASGDDATVANAISSIKGALNEGTLIDGGLVLTSVLGLRSNSRVWAGISGMYKTAETGTGYKGHGIAAWYGGGMADWEVYYDSLTPTQQQRATITDAYAKSLFRFDGSGYLAGGNITWDKNGSIVIKNITTLSDSQNTNLLNELATFNSAFTFTTIGSGSTTVLSITPNVPFTALTILDTSVTPNVGRPVATQKWVTDNFMTIAAFERLFNAIDANGNKVSHPYSNAFASIKAMVGLWTNQYISAFGQNSSSGGGGSSTLAGLNDVTLSSPQAGQALVYRDSHWVNEFVSQSAIVSIGMTVPTGFLVSPSSLNSSGTFAISFGGSVAKNEVLASPSSAAGAPSWRVLVAADIPNLAASKITSGQFDVAQIPDLSGTYASASYFDENGNAKVANKLGTTTVGGTKKPIYLKNGVATALSESVGTSTKGVYMNSGTITAMTYSLGANLNDGTANYLAYYSDANAVSGTSCLLLLNETNSVSKTVAGLEIVATGYGNAADLISSVAGNITYGDAGPQIRFTPSSKQHIALVATHYDNAGGGTSLHLVSDQTNPIFVTPRIKTNRVYLYKPTGNNDTNAVYLEYDSNNTGVHLVGAGFYSDSYVSAFGANSQSGGGGVGDVTWDLLASSSDTHQIALSHLTTALSGYVAQNADKLDGYHANAFMQLYGGTDLNPSSSNLVNIDTVTDYGNYYCANSSNVQYVSGLPTGITKAFRLYVGRFWTGNRYMYQRVQQFNSIDVYERINTASTVAWGNWYLVESNFENLSNYVTLDTDQNISGNKTFTGGTIIIYGKGTTEQDTPASIIFSTKDTTTGQIYGGCFIKAYNDHSSSTSGNNLIIRPGGNLIMGGGESASGFYSQMATKSGENTYLLADGHVYLEGTGNTIANRRGFYIGTGSNITYFNPCIAETKSSGTHYLGSETSVFGAVFSEGFYLNSDARRSHIVVNKSGTSTTLGYIEFDKGDATNYTIGKWIFVACSPKTEAYPDSTGYYEYYMLPSPTKGLATNAGYTILTTKDLSFSITGNAATATKLASMINVTIKDADSTNAGSAVSVDGSANVTLLLPSTIKASLTGNASTATKLADTTTTFTAWGRTFWSGGQPTNVSGALSDVTDITMSGNIQMDNNARLDMKDSGGAYRTVLRLNASNSLYFCQRTASEGYNTYIYGSSIYLRYGTSGTNGMMLDSNGNVSIYNNATVGGTLGVTGATTVTGLLTANGNIQTGSSNGAYIKIGGLYIVYDSANTALKVSASATGNGAANFYATGAVSALGANTSSGGGSGDVFWNQLTTGTGGQQIAASLLTNVTNPLYILLNDDPNPSITYNGRTNKTLSGIITKTYADARYLSNGNISTLTFSNGANNRVFSINNNGAVKLDVANVGASNGWEAGYYAKSGSTYIGSFGLFGAGTALEYAFIGKGYNNTWLAVKSNGNVGIGTNITNPSTKLHVDGVGYFTSGVTVGGIDQYHAFYVNGNTRLGGLVGIGTSAQSGYSLYVNGTTYFNGDVDITKGKTIYFQHTASGVPEISIGTKSNDQNLYLKGINLYFNSSIISSSDMRLKNVDKQLVGCDIESIAEAPIFYYRWKKTPEFGPHLGSSAQYWQNVFSCAVVKDEEGYLGLDYAATALAAAVMTARKVLDHEDRITELENENKLLKEEIRLLKAV